MSSEVSECKPLMDGMDGKVGGGSGMDGRGLPLSTFLLNVSAFFGIGVAFRGCLGGM